MAYPQLKVKPNLFATAQKSSAVAASPSVMSLSAPRLSPSRPNVDRCRLSAMGRPSEVAVPITGPWTEVAKVIGIPSRVPASKVSKGMHSPSNS